MIYQYNKETKLSEEVKVPEGVMRDQEWVEKFNQQALEHHSNCFYSTEVIIEDDLSVTHEEMDEFFKSMEEDEEE